jgi:hypothetical protein
MKRDNKYALIGREVELNELQAARQTAADAVNEYQYANIQNRPLQYSPEEIYSAVCVTFFNAMRPYLKKYVPEEYEKLKEIKKLISAPPVTVAGNVRTLGSHKTVYQTYAAIMQVPMEKVIEYYYVMEDLYIELDWGAPAPHVIDELDLGDYGDIEAEVAE